MEGPASTYASLGHQVAQQLGLGPVQSFRRLEYTGSGPAFWENLILSAGYYNGQKKTQVQIPRAELPLDVMFTADPAQLAAAGKHAVQSSFVEFMNCVEAVRSPGAAENSYLSYIQTQIDPQAILMLEMRHVGIKCEGRSGPYDLIYFPHNDKVYAADSRDDSILYVLS